jgi:hypothetical protein
MFPTLSKQKPDPVVGLERLRRWRSWTRPRCDRRDHLENALLRPLRGPSSAGSSPRPAQKDRSANG